MSLNACRTQATSLSFSRDFTGPLSDRASPWLVLNLSFSCSAWRCLALVLWDSILQFLFFSVLLRQSQCLSCPPRYLCSLRGVPLCTGKLFHLVVLFAPVKMLAGVSLAQTTAIIKTKRAVLCLRHSLYWRFLSGSGYLDPCNTVFFVTLGKWSSCHLGFYSATCGIHMPFSFRLLHHYSILSHKPMKYW